MELKGKFYDGLGGMFYMPDAATRQFEKDWAYLQSQVPCHRCKKPLGYGSVYMKNGKRYHTFECEQV